MKSAPHRAASRGAFTLLEILVVIAIIAILAALLLNTAGYIQEKAGNSRAEVEIKALETALEAYKQDNGSYPESSAGGNANGSDSSSIVLLEALNRTPATASPPTKIYLAELGKMLPPVSGNPKASYDDKLKSATRLVDPFGNPYHYKYPGDADRSGTNFFDLWSQGKKDDANDTNKWIKNW